MQIAPKDFNRNRSKDIIYLVKAKNMDDFEEKTLKKNPSYRKPISYSTEFRLNNNLNNFVEKL